MYGNEGIALGRMKQRVNKLETIIFKLKKGESLTIEEQEIVNKIIKTD